MDTPVRRILLVEDEADIRASLKQLVEDAIPNCEVVTAGGAAEALAALRDLRPHLIVSDYKMPGMNGVEFLKAARELSPRAPRVLMTAFPDLGVATRAVNDAHIRTFLAKPIDPGDMLAKIERLLAKLPRDEP